MYAGVIHRCIKLIVQYPNYIYILNKEVDKT